jgi:hypothetical protein
MIVTETIVAPLVTKSWCMPAGAAICAPRGKSAGTGTHCRAGAAGAEPCAGRLAAATSSTSRATTEMRNISPAGSPALPRRPRARNALGYHVTLVKDATAAYTEEMMSAHELDGPNFAHAILTTSELVAALSLAAARLDSMSDTATSMSRSHA